MTCLPLTLQPDPILNTPTRPVQNIADPLVQNLISDMFATMEKEHGVGLAATQVGKDLQLAVIAHGTKRYTIINPEIITQSPEYVSFTEGCLSIPGKEFTILRHEKITVRYTNAQNIKTKMKLKGFLAIVFQHEIDHLHGILIADRFTQQASLRKKFGLKI